MRLQEGGVGAAGHRIDTLAQRLYIGLKTRILNVLISTRSVIDRFILCRQPCRIDVSTQKRARSPAYKRCQTDGNRQPNFVVTVVEYWAIGIDNIPNQRRRNSTSRPANRATSTVPTAQALRSATHQRMSQYIGQDRRRVRARHADTRRTHPHRVGANCRCILYQPADKRLPEASAIGHGIHAGADRRADYACFDITSQVRLHSGPVALGNIVAKACHPGRAEVQSSHRALGQPGR
ncbi:hypothetical protein D3C87_1288010 [compost metagenome]